MTRVDYNNMSAYSKFDSSYSSISGAFEDIFAEFGDDHRERIQRYRLNWQYYEGDHWSNSQEFTNRNVTVNYASRIVDIKGVFLSKGAFTINIPEISDASGESELSARNFIKARLDEIWKGKAATFLLQGTQQGGVTGDCFIKVVWDNGNWLRPKNPVASIIPSIHVFPVWNPIRKEEMDECWIAYPIVDEEVHMKRKFPYTSQSFSSSKVVKLYKERWTPTLYEQYLGDELIESKEHNLGILPIVHIQNYPNTNSRYGISDLKGIKSLQRQYNEKATDISDVIDYHGSPQTIISGARIDQLERGPDKIWATPDGSKVYNLELIGNLKANIEYLATLKSSILDIASVPEQALNPTSSVSNTPGVALHMSYMPLVEARTVKSTEYGTGISKVNTIMLRYLELYDSAFSAEFTKLPSPGRYITDIKFGEALPRDELLRIENERSRLEMGVTSRKRILMEEYGYGEQDADRIVLESDEDAKARAMAKVVIDEAVEAPYGKQRRPDPVVQGDRISQNAVNTSQ